MNSNFTGFATVLAASVAWSYTGSPLVAGGLGYLGYEAWDKQRREEVAEDTRKMFGESAAPRLVAQVQEQAQAQQQSQSFNPTFSPTFNPVLNIEAPQSPAPPQAPQPSPTSQDYPQPPRAASTANYEPLAIDSALPTVDAPAMVGECQGHVLLSCRTGSGKTTFLQQAIAHAHALGAAIWVVDPKGSQYLGLERTPDYHPVRRGDDGATPVRVLSNALRELDSRIEARRANARAQARPLVIVLDEWVTILARSEPQRKRILELVQEILLMGREDGVFIWLVGQSHYTQDCGLNRSLQSNFSIFALGRAGAWQSLELAVEDSNLVRLKSDRERLQTELLRLRQANRQEPICYSSHNGGSLAVLPHCPKDSLPDIVPPGVQLAVVPEPEEPAPDFVIPLEPEPGVARRVVRHG